MAPRNEQRRGQADNLASKVEYDEETKWSVTEQEECERGQLENGLKGVPLNLRTLCEMIRKANCGDTPQRQIIQPDAGIFRMTAHGATQEKLKAAAARQA